MDWRATARCGGGLLGVMCSCGAVVACGLAFLGLAPVAFGQTGSRPAEVASRPAGAATAPAELPASLQGISGITPGMTTDQLIDAGTGAVSTGRLDHGRKILLVAVARDRANLRALSALAYAYERTAEQVRGDASDPEAGAKADRFIDQAVGVYLTAGAVALAQDQFTVAEQMHDRVLLHRPGNAKALLGLARIYAATDRWRQAIPRYRSYLATSEGAQDPRGYLELGELYLDATYWRQAMDQFSQAQKISPNDPDVDMAMAKAYQQGDRMPDAMKYAKAAADKAPDQAKYRHLLSELYLAQGDGEQASIEALRAIEFTRKALQASPDSHERLKELGRYYEAYENALGSLIKEGKANPVVRIDLARAIQEHAGVDRRIALRRALKVLTDASADSREDARLLEELAGVQLALGLDKQVRETCRQLLQIDPGNAAAGRIIKELEAPRAP